MRFTIVLAAACALCATTARSAFRGEELRHEDAPVKKHLEENVPPIATRPRPPSKESVALFVQMLEKGDHLEMERAAWALGDWGGPLALAPLLKACDNERVTVRTQAASSLGMLGPSLQGDEKAKTAQKLAALLGDKDRRVVLAALRALGKLKTLDASGLTAKYAASDDTELAIAAIRAIGEAGDPKQFAHISKGLVSENGAVAMAAIEATGRLGDVALAQRLAVKLNSDSPAQTVAAVRVMVSLKADRYLPQLLALMKHPRGSIRREALIALRRLGGAKYARQYLAYTKDPDHTVRRAAAQAIGEFQLQNGVDLLYTLFADPHHYVRQDAVGSMVVINTDAVRTKAGQGLGSGKDTVRECSSQTLGRLKSDVNLTAHIQLLKDKHLRTRRWAAWALGEIGRKEASEALHTCAFQKAQDVETAGCAILSLGKLGHTKSLPPMRKITADKPTLTNPGSPMFMRIASIRSMGWMKNEGSVGLLQGRLNDMTGDMPDQTEVRFEAAVGLGRIGSRKAVATLTSHMNAAAETPDIRGACQWSLLQITGTKPTLELPVRYPYPPQYFIRHKKPRKKRK